MMFIISFTLVKLLFLLNSYKTEKPLQAHFSQQHNAAFEIDVLFIDFNNSFLYINLYFQFEKSNITIVTGLQVICEIFFFISKENTPTCSTTPLQVKHSVF